MCLLIFMNFRKSKLQQRILYYPNFIFISDIYCILIFYRISPIECTFYFGLLLESYFFAFLASCVFVKLSNKLNTLPFYDTGT